MPGFYFPRNTLKPIPNWRLYVVTDERLSKGRSHVETARLAVEGGVDALQLRDKNASGKKLFEMALEIREITKDAGAAFIMNDRVDIAIAAGCDGIHLGQADLPLPAARKLVGREMIIGVSISGVTEATQAFKDGADYVSISPLFDARKTKPDAGEPLGLQALRDVSKECRLPVMAIGGINKTNIPDAIQAGAQCAAVISAVVGAEDIPLAVRELTRLIEREKQKYGI